MEYKIIHEDAFPLVECKLQQGETLKAESDAMVSMTGNLDIRGSMDRNILGGLARRFLAGESFFFQTITASRGPGTVLLGHAAPGGIVDVELDGSYSLRVQKDGFLAGTSRIEVDTTIQNLTQGLFSREGFFVHAINLNPGEEVVIDNGHLVAWPDYMHYRIEKASSNGWISSFVSGEGLVCRFTGPGVVLIQTRKPEAFSAWLRSMLPTSN